MENDTVGNHVEDMERKDQIIFQGMKSSFGSGIRMNRSVVISMNSRLHHFLV